VFPAAKPKTIDQRVASYGNPEDEHLHSERLVWLVEQFKDDPELLEILRLQLERAGYNAFSSQELAKRLSTTVVEIENRRRRVIRRFRDRPIRLEWDWGLSRCCASPRISGA
jgi:hypothetical protein